MPCWGYIASLQSRLGGQGIDWGVDKIPTKAFATQAYGFSSLSMQFPQNLSKKNLLKKANLGAIGEKDQGSFSGI